MIYDLLIVGGGPAGAGAAVYAGRKKMKTVLIAQDFGGQSLVSADIQNWIGEKSISGLDLAKKLEEHVRAQEIDVIGGDLVVKVEKMDGGGFKAVTKNGAIIETKTVLAVSGSRRRKLGIPGEKEFEGRGVAYCSTCDAPIFGGKITAVVGGGNAGLEAVLDLVPYSAKIYLLERTGTVSGDKITQEKIQANPKVEVIFNAEPQKILGDKFVTGLQFKDTKTGSIKELKLDGVFVEIGSIPNNEFVKDLVRVNNNGEIVVDHQTQRASLDGIWAAGDVSDVLYNQNNVAAGDAIKAVLNIYEYLCR